MVFSSTVFLFLFLPSILLVYYNPIIRSRKFKNAFLLVASLFFYAWGEPVNILLMMFSIGVGWAIGIRIQSVDNQKKRKKWLSIGITVFVTIFFIFKYLTFVMNQLFRLFNKEQNLVHIALPIGISFFLFQLMSYLFDVYYNKAPAQKNILNLGLYISLFPQLIAGPIVRYADIEKAIENRQENFTDFSQGMMRFSLGLGKKVILANYLGIMVDNIFLNVGKNSVATAWIGACSYAMQIYFDFSGYSDMAIGLGKMFGFHFLENFNYPYLSTSVTEFWRRWHISLGSWFRDYVYISLGGNRVNKAKWIRNLFVVWLLTGIWHGANWTFLFWGLLYFGVLLMEKLLFVENTNIPIVLKRIYTLLIVIVAWVIFRADNILHAYRYIHDMFIIGKNGFMDYSAVRLINSSKWILILGIICATPLLSKIGQLLKKHGQYWLVGVANISIFVISVILCVSSSYNPFIYFNF